MDKSEFRWTTVEEYKQHDFAEDVKQINSTERHAQVARNACNNKTTFTTTCRRPSPVVVLAVTSNTVSIPGTLVQHSCLSAPSAKSWEVVSLAESPVTGI